MADLNEGVVEAYAEHLLRKAASAVVSFAVGGAVGGAGLGAVPGLLSHSVISPGVNYFAVLLGAIAGGFLGRTIGDRRAVGLRLQAQMALRQLQLESRLVARPAVPATVPPAVPAQAAPVPPVQAPPALPAPSLAPEPPASAPVPAPQAPTAPPAIRTDAPIAATQPLIRVAGAPAPALPPLTAPPLSQTQP